MAFTGQYFPFNPIRILATPDGYWAFSAVDGDDFRWPLGHVIVHFDKAFNICEAYALPPMRGASNLYIEPDSTFNFVRHTFTGFSNIEYYRFPLDSLRKLPLFCPSPQPREFIFPVDRTLTMQAREPISIRTLPIQLIPTTPLQAERTTVPLELPTYDVQLLPQDSVCATYTPAFGPDEPDRVTGVEWGDTRAPESAPGTYTLAAAPDGSSRTAVVTVATEQLGCPRTYRDTLTASALDTPDLLALTLDCATGTAAGSVRLAAPTTTLLWDDGAGTDPARAFGAPGTYTYVTLQGNCRARGTAVVTAGDCPTGGALPTAFSPNGDGVNDAFRCAPEALWQLARLEVYDRWGGLQAVAAGPEGWNGRAADGRALPPGTYVYRATYRINDGTSDEAFGRGEVTVVR